MAGDVKSWVFAFRSGFEKIRTSCPAPLMPAHRNPESSLFSQRASWDLVL